MTENGARTPGHRHRRAALLSPLLATACYGGLVVAVILVTGVQQAAADPTAPSVLDQDIFETAVTDSELDKARGGAHTEQNARSPTERDQVSVILWDEAPGKTTRGRKSAKSAQTRSSIGGARFD